MPRLFSSFPAGSAGTGLFLLRALLAAEVLAQAATRLASALATGHVTATTVGCLLWILCGCAVLSGFLTPVAHAFIAIGAGHMLTTGMAANGWPSTLSFAWWWPPLFELILAAGLALVGPGAYSVDARLFGRREIVLKPGERRPLR